MNRRKFPDSAILSTCHDVPSIEVLLIRIRWYLSTKHLNELLRCIAGSLGRCRIERCRTAQPLPHHLREFRPANTPRDAVHPHHPLNNLRVILSLRSHVCPLVHPLSHHLQGPAVSADHIVASLYECVITVLRIPISWRHRPANGTRTWQCRDGDADLHSFHPYKCILCRLIVAGICLVWE